MTFSTQSSSKPRLKNDTLGDDAIKELSNAFITMNIEPFEKLCIKMIQMGGGKQEKKDKIIKAVKASTKYGKLKKTMDFILAGMGLGV